MALSTVQGCGIEGCGLHGQLAPDSYNKRYVILLRGNICHKKKRKECNRTLQNIFDPIPYSLPSVFVQNGPFFFEFCFFTQPKYKKCHFFHLHIGVCCTVVRLTSHSCKSLAYSVTSCLTCNDNEALD